MKSKYEIKKKIIFGNKLNDLAVIKTHCEHHSENYGGTTNK